MMLPKMEEWRRDFNEIKDMSSFIKDDELLEKYTKKKKRKKTKKGEKKKNRRKKEKWK